jgi:glutamine cyclotransferase
MSWNLLMAGFMQIFIILTVLWLLIRLMDRLLAEVDLSELYADSVRAMKDFDGFVLNGIAWDSKGKRLFVTGKKWDKLFQIKLGELQ